MFLEIVNFAIHSILPEKLSEASLNYQFANHREQVNRAADTSHHQPDCKKATAGLSGFTSWKPTVEMVMTDM